MFAVAGVPSQEDKAAHYRGLLFCGVIFFCSVSVFFCFFLSSPGTFKLEAAMKDREVPSTFTSFTFRRENGRQTDKQTDSEDKE